MPKLCNADRIRIQALHESGKSISHLSRTFKVNRKVVQKWINRPQNQVVDKKRSGHPSKVTPRLSRQIKHDLQQQQSSLRKLGYKYSISHNTIRNSVLNCNQPLYPYKVPTRTTPFYHFKTKAG